MVAERGGFLGRADDVGEEHGGKHAVDRDGRTRAGQKLLDRIGDIVGIVADEGRWSIPGTRDSGSREYAGRESGRPRR